MISKAKNLLLQFAVCGFCLTLLGRMANAGHQCGVDQIEATAFSYCITTLPNSDQNSVIYHLHGRNLDEKIWDDSTYYTELLKEEWAQTKAKPPIVIAISLGKVWALAPKGNAAKTGQREIFLLALRKVEEKYALRFKKRFLLGESMGGFNSVQLLDSGLFKKVAILCPTIYEIEYPFSFSALWKLIKKTNMEYGIAFGLWWLQSDYVESASDWQAISPLAIVETLRKENAPQLYVSCGTRDQYGNFMGTKKFVSVAQERGLSVEWHPMYSRHCGIDIRSLSRFLTDESMDKGKE